MLLLLKINRMGKYNFDEIIERKNTNSVKYDAMAKYLGVTDAIPMWVADMDFKSPPCVIEAIEERVKHGVYGYSIRPQEYYSAIVNWEKRRHGWDINPDWISFSPGVVAGLSILIEEFTQPGDKIVIQSPVYFPFFQTIDSLKRKTVYNKLKLENGRYCIDFDDLVSQIDPSVKMLVLSNPHNPGGSVWTKAELTKLSEICIKNNILVVSDEIHGDMVYKPHKFVPYASISPEASINSITLTAASKTFNLAGFSTSIVISENKKYLRGFERRLHIPHLHMGNIFGTVALTTAFNKGEEWLSELMEYLQCNVDMVNTFFKTHLPKIEVIYPESTFLIWLNCKATGYSDKELNDIFNNNAKVAMSPGTIFGPGGEGYMRMNIGCSHLVLEKALIQIKNAFIA